MKLHYLLFHQTGIPSLQLIESILLISQTKFSIAFQAGKTATVLSKKKFTFTTWSDVFSLMETAKHSVNFALELASSRSPQSLMYQFHDLNILRAQIAMFEMEWEEAIQFAENGFKYFPTSTLALDIITTAQWRLASLKKNNTMKNISKAVQEEQEHISSSSSSSSSSSQSSKEAAIEQESNQKDRWNGIEFPAELWCLWRHRIACDHGWHIGKKEDTNFINKLNV